MHLDAQLEATIAKSSHAWLRDRIIFLTRHGSHSYGTNIETSDEDFKGVVIPPAEYFHGFTQVFEQAEFRKPNPDMVLYDLRKFMGLAANCNPNIIEVLWTDASDHVVVTALGERLLGARELFISKKAKHTFSGYAVSQLRRIQTHYRWLKNPPKAPPTRVEFELPERTVIPADQLEAARAAIQKQLDRWSFKDLEYLDDATRIGIVTGMAEVLSEMKIGADEQFHAAGKLLGYADNFLELLDRERRYTARKVEWQQFQEWKKSRNPARAALEEQWGYDCYAADTEFLTDSGWKKFDAVKATDALATVFIRRGLHKNETMGHRPSVFGVEYQRATDRFDAVYNGTMYHITGQHTDVLVTANHRMLIREVERRSKKSFDWELEEASFLPDSFDVVITPTPKTTTYSNKQVFANLPIPDHAYLSLMGWYLSDGCAAFQAKKINRPKSIRIGQKPGGKLSWFMARWHSKYKKVATSSLYEYARKPNSYNPRPHKERVLDVRNPIIVTRVISECGYKEEKRIPRWVFGLSRRLIGFLLRGLVRGDGTLLEHKTKSDSFVYYSKSKKLADDVQELALFGGWESALWGPYASKDCEGRVCSMYQVHLRADAPQFRRFLHSHNVKRVQVEGQRVVCFTVPNGTLITRRNGRIGIHGNCKNAYHLVRLLRMCREILTLGKVIVKRPDRDELLAIRNGAWKYEELVDWAAKQDAELTVLAKTSALPNDSNRKALDKLCQSLVEASLAV